MFKLQNRNNNTTNKTTTTKTTSSHEGEGGRGGRGGRHDDDAQSIADSAVSSVPSRRVRKGTVDTDATTIPESRMTSVPSSGIGSSNNNNSSSMEDDDDDRNSNRTMEDIFGIQLGFEQLYTLVRKLRSGSFATVWVCSHRLSGEQFASKVIDRTKLKPRDDRAVFREVDVLRQVAAGHPGIIALVDFYERPEVFHVVLELARGGDVFDRLARRTTYTEKDARDLARNLLEATQHVHSHGIVHRDLKPENMLLVDDVSDVSLKLADFGFAKRLSDGNPPGKLTTRCGTPAFVAPEILLSVPYTEKCDMWSVGVILYLLLGGYPPFQHENHQGLFRKIRAADYVFHDKYWDKVSIGAKQLISSLLHVDPDVRLSATDALTSSQWINTDDLSLSERDISSTLQEMKRFNARRKLRGAMHAVTWAVTATFWNIDTVSFSGRDPTTDVVHSWGRATSAAASAAAAASSSPTTSAAIRNKKAVGVTFRDMYELRQKIRSGSYATVWEGVDKASQSIPYAIKVVKRKDLKPKDDAQFLNEVAILQSLEHPNIVGIHDFFEEKDYFFLVMELMNGGDVFDRIVKRTHYTEKDARDLAKCLLGAVAFMHSHGVAHRDLKPQNLLLANLDDDADMKVADFGFAKRVHTPKSLISRCGTPTYVAPEILKNHPHDCSADMWSVGVIIYVLLVGYPPFMEENQRVLFRKIRMGDYEFYPEDWNDISTSAKELIQSLLVVDPTKRMIAKDALCHEWICDLNDDDLSMRDLSGSLSELRLAMKMADLDETEAATMRMRMNSGSRTKSGDWMKPTNGIIL